MLCSCNFCVKIVIPQGHMAATCSPTISITRTNKKFIGKLIIQNASNLTSRMWIRLKYGNVIIAFFYISIKLTVWSTYFNIMFWFHKNSNYPWPSINSFFYSLLSYLALELWTDLWGVWGYMGVFFFKLFIWPYFQ